MSTLEPMSGFSVDMIFCLIVFGIFVVIGVVVANIVRDAFKMPRATANAIGALVMLLGICASMSKGLL